MSLLWGGGKLSESQYTDSTCRHILEQFQDSLGREITSQMQLRLQNKYRVNAVSSKVHTKITAKEKTL